MRPSRVTRAGEWENYSRAHRCRPHHVAAPASHAELAAELAAATRRGERVRVIGSGHSYNDVALAPETQLRLDRMTRVEHVDPARGLVRVEAGITIQRLREVLAEHGLGFANLGDTDGQTLAGALSTGTHGSGVAAPAFSSQVAALELMLADGSRLEVSAERAPDVFAAARVALGALGVITAVTLRAIPLYALHRVDEVVSRADALALIADPPAVDHFGVWLMPYADKAVTWTSTRVALGGRPPARLGQFLRDVVQVNAGLRLASLVARVWPDAVPALDRLFARTLQGETREDRYDRIFLRPILVRHHAYAYAVPRAHGAAAAAALLAAIERTRPPAVLPCEIRFAPADDAWLHPQHGRATTWIGSAMHAPGFDVAPCWAEAETACLAYEGRPHWAKWHRQRAADLAPRYPRWADFQAVRARLDPTGRFGSPAIDRVLGGRS